MFDDQSGVVTRMQAIACGVSAAKIRAQVRSGRWQPVYRSVYAVFSGPIPRDAQLWAAVLRTGPGAVLSHQSAAELGGLIDRPEPLIHVTVRSGRRLAPIPGIAVHQSCRVDTARHPGRQPPQTRIEETVVDLVQASPSLEPALGWITRAVGRRLTVPDRLAAAVRARKRLRWRDELLAVLHDVDGGAQSPLEIRYLRDVERAHGLPPASRQHSVVRNGRRTYDDVRYPGLDVVIELDGRRGHADDARWRDMRRDNASVVDGCRVLRYGWADVAGRPCQVAAQVLAVLRAAGWRGTARPCGPGCTAASP